MTKPSIPGSPGDGWVYTPYFVHWRSRKRVYRKNGGMFRFPRRPRGRR
jgi:hypothetical protein